MKVILSRKGFDSSVGGCASPILPDGRLVSLPIPTSMDHVSYASLRSPCGRSYFQLLKELGGESGIAGRGAHVDPVLERPDHVELSNQRWRASLGQIGAAAGHLRNQGVGVGDLFLFYGWFRHTLEVSGRLQYARDPGVHLIFGYLEVGEVMPFTRQRTIPEWLSHHPHAHPARRAISTNTLYLARDRLSRADECAGAGVLKFDERRVLTASGLTRGRWRLDRRLFGNACISYHDESAWKDGYFQSYPRAQEYVIEANEAIAHWAYELIRERGTS